MPARIMTAPEIGLSFVSFSLATLAEPPHPTKHPTNTLQTLQTLHMPQTLQTLQNETFYARFTGISPARHPHGCTAEIALCLVSRYRLSA